MCGSCVGHDPRMAPPLSDAVIVDVLRRVDRLLSPGATRLGRPPALPQAERDQWWADRVSRVAAGVVAPRPGSSAGSPTCCRCRTRSGRRCSRVVVLGVAGEHGVTDPAERVSLLARVLLGRDLPAEPGRAAAGAREGHLPRRTRSARARAGAARCAPSGGPPGCSAGSTTPSTPAPRASCATGRWPNLPVVGVLGGYAAEREGLRRAARRAAAALDGRVSR